MLGNLVTDSSLNGVGNSPSDLSPWLFPVCLLPWFPFSLITFILLICSFSKEFLRDYYILASVLGAGNSTKSKTGRDSCPPGVYRPIGWRCWGETKIFRGCQERLHCRWWLILSGGLILLCFGRLASEDGGLGYGSFHMIFTCFVLNQ